MASLEYLNILLICEIQHANDYAGEQKYTGFIINILNNKITFDGK